jgi:hypothetical protein
MNKKKSHIEIIKVPLSDNERPSNRSKNFPYMPILYLELLENKKKIKQDLINKPYVPSNSPQQISPDISKITIDHDDDDILEDNKSDISHYSSKSDKYNNDSSKYKNIKSFKYQTDKPSVDIDSDEDLSNKYSSESKKDYTKNIDKYNDKKYNDKNSDSDNDNYSKSKYSSINKYSSSSITDKSNRNKYDDGDEINENFEKESVKSDDSTESNIIAQRLKQLLTEDEPKSSNKSHYSKHSDHDTHSLDRNASDKYSKDYPQNSSSHFSKHKSSSNNCIPSNPLPPTTNIAPTLDELQKTGHYEPKIELRDISQFTMNESDQEDAKRELLFKFELLKKSYPNSTMLDYSIHSNFQEMKKGYEGSVRRLSLDSTVENYKTYLIGGFMVVEFVFGNFLRFDMAGFTQQQILSMNSYEKLLIELGEKSYVPGQSRWPCELRLLFLIMMNTGMFIISKVIMQKTGASLMGMINGMNTANIPKKAKSKMRGPSFRLDDLPDVEDIPPPVNT